MIVHNFKNQFVSKEPYLPTGQDTSDGPWAWQLVGRDIRPVRILLVVPPLDLGASHLFSRPSSYIEKEGQRTQPVVS